MSAPPRRERGRPIPAWQAFALVLAAGVLASSPSTAQETAVRDARSDYPTAVTADYVFGCMATNGNSRTALEQCACSFDVVASLIPYKRYVEAETFLSMGQVTGEKGVIFRTSEESKASIGDLRRAQAEAEVRCFE